ncbi:hypothetical protein ACUOCP_55665, partial [Escherichia sp. R-CC3]
NALHGKVSSNFARQYFSEVIEDEGRISVLDSYHDLIQKQQNYRGTESYMTSEKYWRAKLEETLPWSANSNEEMDEKSTKV